MTLLEDEFPEFPGDSKPLEKRMEVFKSLLERQRTDRAAARWHLPYFVAICKRGKYMLRVMAPAGFTSWADFMRPLEGSLVTHVLTLAALLPSLLENECFLDEQGLLNPDLKRGVGLGLQGACAYECSAYTWLLGPQAVHSSPPLAGQRFKGFVFKWLMHAVEHGTRPHRSLA